ncbi:MAG TPA: hypothetical protein VFA63_11130 [Pseudonocardiaceae bacterium]|nr:hypothetical protein [Pseudonocardiaceae bacterium]
MTELSRVGGGTATSFLVAEATSGRVSVLRGEVTRLQGARMPEPPPQLDQRPTRVQRTVSCRGGTQIIGQRVQVGLRYAGQIVTIEVDDTTLRIYDQHDHLIKNVPRTSRKEVCRRKAYGHTTNHTTA